MLLALAKVWLVCSISVIYIAPSEWDMIPSLPQSTATPFSILVPKFFISCDTHNDKLSYTHTITVL